MRYAYFGVPFQSKTTCLTGSANRSGWQREVSINGSLRGPVAFGTLLADRSRLRVKGSRP